MPGPVDVFGTGSRGGEAIIINDRQLPVLRERIGDDQLLDDSGGFVTEVEEPQCRRSEAFVGDRHDGDCPESFLDERHPDADTEGIRCRSDSDHSSSACSAPRS
ncbi:MAG: hypothetical protein R2849_02705 [Thermomicrobiales bacterium]